MPVSKVLWTPDGIVGLDRQAERVELRAGVMEWLRQFQDVATALGLGVHCAKCGNDLVGKNSDSDKVFAATCGCREFIGPNRDYTPSSPMMRH